MHRLHERCSLVTTLTCLEADTRGVRWVGSVKDGTFSPASAENESGTPHIYFMAPVPVRSGDRGGRQHHFCLKDLKSGHLQLCCLASTLGKISLRLAVGTASDGKMSGCEWQCTPLPPSVHIGKDADWVGRQLSLLPEIV